MRKKLTDALLDSIETQSKIQIIHDTQLSRFAVRISRLHKTFYIQADKRKAAGGNRRTHQIRIGRHPFITVAEARAKAVALLGDIDAGKEPSARAQAAHQTTLRDAWAAYRIGLERKKRSAKTLKSYSDSFDRLLVSIHDEPLSALGDNPRRFTQLHEKIAATSGRPTADAAARFARAVFRHAAKNDPSLDPGKHLARGVDFAGTKAAPDDAMTTDELAEWFVALKALDNPIRESFHLFSILTGLRKNDVITLAPAAVNYEAKTAFIKAPKGNRPFTLPLSSPAIAALRRAQEAGAILHPAHARNFCFAGQSGYLRGTGEYRPAGKKLLTGHSLRRTFASQAPIAGVPGEIVARLLGHKSSEHAQTAHYQSDRVALDFYATQMQKIGEHLVAALIPDPDERRRYL